ncbi:MAG: radical SAM protein [Candidatus Methanoperedens sp.]|nr:radical SAM protein [Candidatus Methanoperedens sp.]
MFTPQTKISMAKALLTKNSPFYIQFYVSNVCYLRCKMCNIVEANTGLEPFGTEDIERIADNLVKIGAGVILLTGGEPFMRKDIEEIVRIFKLKNLDVRLQTAGLYSRREKIAKCVEYGARDINVSIDSLDEQLSDYINGAEGSWKNAIKTISFISNVFPKKDSICALGCVLSKYNIDEIEAVLDFATRIGWWLSLVPVHITTPDSPMNFRGYDEYFKFTEEDFPKVKGLIERLKRKKREGFMLFDSDDYLDSIYHFISTGHPNWRHRQVCDSPNLYFAILPDGRFAPCCDFKFNENLYVYDRDFPKIYKSREFRDKVMKITQQCPGCNFGSYPEMTLSARSFSTIRERISLQLKAQSTGLKTLGEDEIFNIILNIKKEYDVYKEEGAFRFRENKKWPNAKNIPQQLWNEKQ